MSKAVSAMRGIRRKVRGFWGDGVASVPNRLLSISLTEKVPLSKDLRGVRKWVKQISGGEHSKTSRVLGVFEEQKGGQLNLLTSTDSSNDYWVPILCQGLCQALKREKLIPKAQEAMKEIRCSKLCGLAVTLCLLYPRTFLIPLPPTPVFLFLNSYSISLLVVAISLLTHDVPSFPFLFSLSFLLPHPSLSISSSSFLLLSGLFLYLWFSVV